VPAPGDPQGLADACLCQAVQLLTGLPDEDWRRGAAHAMRTPDRKSAVLVLTDPLSIHQRVRQSLSEFKKSPRLSDDIRRKLQQFQAAERQRAKTPPSGGGFFSISSNVGSKP